MALVSDVKARLLDLIKSEGELSVDEATSRLGLSKTTTRQHCLTLERQGLVERRFRQIERGRPQLAYGISDAGARMYPSSDPRLLRELLVHLLKAGHEETVKSFFQSFWRSRKDRFKSRLALEKEDTPEMRAQVLGELLEEEGFMPKVEVSSSRRLTIRECNCPFSEAVKATSIPCKLEAEFIQSAIGHPATRVTYIPSGAPACMYEFEPVRKREPTRKKDRLS